MTTMAAPETLTLEQLAVLAEQRSERIRVLARARMNELFAAIVATQR
jgi:hypothetical protein